MNLEPLFKISKRKMGKEIKGDVIEVKEKKGIKWKNQLYTAFLTEEGKNFFNFRSKQDSFIQTLTDFFENEGISEGYLVCNEGELRNIRCGFYLTYHKPSPLFAEALFRGSHKIHSIIGFFLRPGGRNDKKPIVPHLHIMFENRETGKLTGGHLMDADGGNLKCDVIPLTGASLKRIADPNTGVMHLRSNEPKQKNTKSKNIMIFSLAPGESFPNQLFNVIPDNRRDKAHIRFALGTLRSALLDSSPNNSVLEPPDGLEVLYAFADVKNKSKYSQLGVYAYLLDKFGQVHQGNLLQSEVKDLVEGVMILQ